MKKIMKIVFAFIILIFIILSIQANATDSVMQGAEDFINSGDKTILNTGTIKDTSNTIFNFFAMIGTAVVLMVGVILGIKLIVGSIEEKAKVKAILIPYLIGSIAIFAAFGIWSLAVNVLQNIF